MPAHRIAHISLSLILTLVAMPGCAAAPRATLPEGLAETVAENLQVPWAIAFLPSGDLLVTERPGTLVRIGEDRKRYPVEGVQHIGEGGLLGIALHPEFAKNNRLYLYLTTSTAEGVRNRVERYRLSDDRLTERREILSDIPGSPIHDGGALAFGPDGFLYVTTGDAGQQDRAQDTQSLAGKILRIADDGSIPVDNPFGNAVYSYGHRNVQGIAWDAAGRLWSTEHGRSGVLSGLDELNRIEKGKNYGWPVIQGSRRKAGMERPALDSGSRTTWAPASAAYANGSIFFGGLRGEALYEAVLPTRGGGRPRLRTHLKGMLGRIRAVAIGPDGSLYLSTSNTDGRGDPRAGDDRILKIDVEKLR